MKKYILAIAALLVLSGCSALRVQADYDKDFDFKSLSKFTLLDTMKDDGNDFTRSRINKTLIKHFENKGYSLVKKEDADFYIQVFLNVNINREVKTDTVSNNSVANTGVDFILNCKPVKNTTLTSCFMQQPLPLTQTTTTTVTERIYDYEEGKLVVELIDVKTNSIVWQGTAIDELSELSANEEKVIEKLLKDFLVN